VRLFRDVVLLAVSLLAVSPFASAGNAAAGVACVANAGVPPIVRVEGLSELVGDLVLYCTGGTPTPAGQVVPAVNLTILLSTNITSRVVTPPFTETLLIVDEPYSAVHPMRSLLNCGNTGASDSGPSGPGVCSILGSGNSDATYDGTANAWGTQACDSLGGRPAPNSYGCGRPNVFQGKLGTVSDPSQNNAVTFFSVPFDAPGSAPRILRITNLRGNAAVVGIASFGSLSNITAEISANGSPSIQINNPTQLIAYVESGLGQTNCGTVGPGTRVRFCEQFSSAFRPKNISSYTGDHAGILPDATLLQGQSYPTYNGGTNYPGDVAQNVPGAIYNVESGFEWQNNSTNGPPLVNPPNGIGTLKVTASGNPLKSTGAGGLDTGIASAGVVESGTRIAFQFQSIPAGASVQVPDVLYLFRTGASYNGDPTQYQFSATGVMVRTAVDSSGAGPFNPVTGTLAAGSSLAVYEVLWADPYSTEFTELPYTILNAPPDTNVQVALKLAPFYPSSSAGGTSSISPLPRFTNGACSVLNCVVVSPAFGSNTSSALSVTFTADPAAGINMTNAQVVLRADGQNNISGVPSSSSFTVLTATFNLSGAATGYRDVILVPQTGPEVTLAQGFLVNNVSTCSYGISPSTISVAAAGAATGFLVFPNPAPCTWSATTDVSWITIGQPVQYPSEWDQPITVAPNPDSSQRTGTVSAAGLSVTVGQEPNGQPCSYTVTPSSVTVPAAGGNATFNVTTNVGCPWTQSNSIPWVNGYSGGYAPQFGIGGGTFQYFVDRNPGPARYASASLAGQTVTLNQSGSTASAAYFSVNSGSTATAGVPIQFTVTALDSSNATVTAYSDPVHFTSTDPSAVLPADTTLTNGTGVLKASLVTVGLQTLTVSDPLSPSITGTGGSIAVSAASGLRFVPVRPCRIVDTRNGTGGFTGPIGGGATQNFNPQGSCGIPGTAQAYSLNVAVVPVTTLGFVTAWPAGQARPVAATLNSLDGRIKSNASIVPSGTGGAISVFASDATQLILDINGYFVPNAAPGALAFYPVTPCRLVDTRNGTLLNGAFGAGTTRTLPILSSSCNVPSAAQAYSLNFVAVTSTPVGFLTAYPTGGTRPLAATLNDLTGTIAANAAIVPAGTGGSVDVFASDATQLVVDINGYFAPAGAGGLSLYSLTPCRVLDTRQPPGSPRFTGQLDVNVLGSGCGGTPQAQAYVLNATVVPQASFGFLTLWPQGIARPAVATLNALDGAITNDMAIVPTNNTDISAFASDMTHLILDMSAYFAP
jgi:hypothetical protein